MKDVVFAFVQAINQPDLASIIKMMAVNFIFIDTYGGQTDREAMKTGWQGYFDWFPDYHITIEDYMETEQFAVILGKASGAYLGNQAKAWEFPAAWKVVVAEKQVVNLASLL